MGVFMPYFVKETPIQIIRFGKSCKFTKLQSCKFAKLKNWKMNRNESHTWSEGYKFEGETRILKKRSF